MTVSKIYKNVAKLYGIESVFKYAKKNNIEVSFYSINQANELILVEGRGNSFGEQIMMNNIGNNTQGSYLDNQHLLEYEDANFILLSLRDTILPNKNEIISLFTEMIVIHEMAHLIDQHNLLGLCAYQLTECDRIIGERIQVEANRIADRIGSFQDMVHNHRFGGILNHLIKSRYADLSPYFMKISMSRTLIETEDNNFYMCKS